MASLDEVDRRLRELIERLRATYWAQLAQGRLGDLAPGEPEEETDVRIRAASDDLVALVEGDLSFVSAYLTGKVRVDAAVADLLQLRRML